MEKYCKEEIQRYRRYQNGAQRLKNTDKYLYPYDRGSNREKKQQKVVQIMYWSYRGVSRGGGGVKAYKKKRYKHQMLPEQGWQNKSCEFIY